AQQLANEAQGTANAKGRVIFSSTAPDAEDRLPQNLWVDTSGNPPINKPKRWDGSNWVEVTDKAVIDAAAAAAAAQASANSAHTAAGNAQNAADRAINAASHNSKNLFSYSPPSGSAPKGTIWFQRHSAANKKIIGQWQQIGGTEPNPDGSGGTLGSTWEQQTISSEVIANLDVGKLTADSGTIGDLVAETF